MGERGPGRFLGARTVLCCALALIGWGAVAHAAEASRVTISGSVSDPSGRPLAGAHVSRAPVMDDFEGYTRRLVPGVIWAEPVEVVVTGVDGRYAFTAEAGERWRLIVDHPEYATVTRRLEPIYHDREMEPVTLGPARELEIRIRTAGGGPVEGARLMAYSGSVTGDLWPHSWTPGVTDASGVARVKVAAPGPWFAEVVPGDLGPADLQEHGRPPMRAELPPASPRSLRVLRSSGEPAAGAVVFRPGRGVTLARTDGDGRATLHGEPGSRMTVSVLTADGESANPSVAFPAPEDPGASDEPLTVRLRAPERLTVSVVSADGSGPIAGARVWGIDDHLERGDDEGLVLFPLPVIWETQKLTVAAPGHAPWQEEELSLAALAGETLVVPLESTAGLSGRVVDGDGRPVAAATVEVRPDDGPWRSSRSSAWLAEGRDGRTGPDGRFAADPLPAGARLGLVVRAPGLAPGLRSLAPLAPGERRTGIEIVLSPGLRATGRVLDPAGQPVAGAIVEVHRTHPAVSDSSPEPRFVAATATTGPDGRFELTDLGPGPAVLHLSAADHRGALPARVQVEILAEIGADSGPRALADLGDLRLTPGHRVAGRVVDGDGAPVPGARVEIRGFGDRQPGFGFEIEEVSSDADGAFVFEDRAAGEHELSARRNEPPSSGTAKAWPPVSAPDGEPVVLVLREGLQLSGRVVDSDGAPIAGAEVESRLRRSLAHPWSATTDGAGNFLLTGLQPGEHRLDAEAEGYLDESRDVLLAEGVEPEPVVVELIAGTTVSGAVRWPDGRPVPGVRVFAQGVEGADWSTSSHTTGPAGGFSVGPVPPGPADVVVLKGDLRVEERIEVGSRPETVTLTVPTGVDVSGRVLDAAGEPVAAVQVRLGSQEDGGTWTGPDGRFVLHDVAPGRHRLLAEHPDYVGYEADGRLEVEDAPIDGLRIELRRGARITGRVEDLASRTGGGRTRVSLDRRDGPESFSADPDSEGRFRFERVPPGEYDAEARTEVVVATGSFTLEPGTEALEIELTPVAGTDLRGRVVQGRRGVSNVRVTVRTEDRAIDDYTDAEGRFVLWRVPEGVDELEVDDPGGHLHTLALAAIEVTGDGELRVELPAGGVAGRVIEATSGRPLARAAVFLESLAADPLEGDWRRRIVRRDRADSRGVFVMYSVAPGRYRVRAEHDGFGLGIREVEVAAEAVGDADVALGPPHRIVLRPTPEPDPADGLGFQYAIFDPEGRLERSSAAGADTGGRIVLDGVPEGDWQVWIADHTSVLQGIDVRVPSDEEIPVERVEAGSVHFDLPDGLHNPRLYDLTVVLRDSQGREPPGPPGVPLRPFVFYERGAESTGEAGVGHLPPGHWTIELRHADGRVWRGEFIAWAGQSAEVTLVRVPPEPSV